MPVHQVVGMTNDGRKAIRVRLGLYRLIEQFIVPEYTDADAAREMMQDAVSEILFGWCKEQMKAAKEEQKQDDRDALGWM